MWFFLVNQEFLSHVNLTAEVCCSMQFNDRIISRYQSNSNFHFLISIADYVWYYKKENINAAMGN